MPKCDAKESISAIHFRGELTQTLRRLKPNEPLTRETTPKAIIPSSVKTFAEIIDLHVQDMLEVGKGIRRSKAAVHGIAVTPEVVRLARVALKRLDLIGDPQERDRRPTQTELDDLVTHFDEKPRQLIPVGRMIRFAVTTAMRQEEICTITWDDVDIRNRIVTVRDRKDPRKKDGNNQRVPMLNLTGYDAWQVLLEQRIVTRGIGRVFPHHHKSAGTAFQRACKNLKNDDLHFHDLRHETTSRLFEAGLTIEKVALVTGHRDWKMLRRYTSLRPESLYPKEKAEEFATNTLTPQALGEMFQYAKAT